jgi:hypothetical protein
LLIFISSIISLFNTSCTKREWNNPYDNIPPEEWAPDNLQVQASSVNLITLSWTDNVIGEEGYKIDRRVNEENWQFDYIVNSANNNIFTDHSVNLEGNYYAYRVYAYAGNRSSSSIDTVIGFPPTVATSEISNVNYNSAKSGGNVIASGSTAVTSRGICWNTSQRRCRRIYKHAFRS